MSIGSLSRGLQLNIVLSANGEWPARQHRLMSVVPSLLSVYVSNEGWC